MKHDLKSSALVIACFDGHGQYGHDVSRFCKNYLEAELVSHPLFLSNLSMAITEVIYALGEGMCVYIWIWLLLYIEMACCSNFNHRYYFDSSHPTYYHYSYYFIIIFLSNLLVRYFRTHR